MLNRLFQLLLLLAFSLGPCWAQSKITVRKSSEPGVDPFEIKQQLMQQQRWREALREQRSFELLYRLPVHCSLLGGDLSDYACNGFFLRPYAVDGQQLYIKIDPPLHNGGAPERSVKHQN